MSSSHATSIHPDANDITAADLSEAHGSPLVSVRLGDNLSILFGKNQVAALDQLVGTLVDARRFLAPSEPESEPAERILDPGYDELAFAAFVSNA